MFKKSLVALGLSVCITLPIYGVNTTGQILGKIEVTKEYGKVDATGSVGNIVGDEVGEFDNPWGMVVLSDGSFWVVDKDNHRIQHFSKLGGFLSKVGKSDSNGYGVSGTEDNEFNTPRYIAKDSDDNIYVTEYYNYYSTESTKIQKFDKDGNHLLTITNDKFKSLLGIAIDSTGNIWVSDYDNHHVWKLNSSGTIIDEIGYVSSDVYDDGTLIEQFTYPYDISMGTNDSIWVVDNGNKRVQHFDKNGDYIEQINTPTNMVPTGMDIDGDNLYVTFLDDGYANHIYHYSTANIVDGKATIKAIYYGYEEARDIDVDNDIFWIVDYENHKVVRAIRDGSQEMTKVLNIGKTNDDGDIVSTKGDFAGAYIPDIIRVDKDNNIWVKDNYSLKKYDNQGNYILGMGKKDINNNFSSYSYIAYTDYMDIKGDNIYLLNDYYDSTNTANSGKYYVQILNLDGTHQTQIEIASGYTGLAVNSDGSFIVAYRYGLIKYAIDGIVLQKIGLTDSDGNLMSGSSNGQFNYIVDVEVDSQNNIYVYESGNDRIQMLDSDGSFVKSNGGQTWSVANLFIDHNDNLWKSSESEYFTKLDKDLISISNFASVYSYDKEEMYSSDLGHETFAFDSNGNLWMADSEYHRISKFTFGTPASSLLAPKVNMTISINDGFTATFEADAYDEDGDIVSYEWSFGDANTSASASTSHVYASIGTYTIGLTVTDNDGVVTSLEQVVKITGNGSTVISSSGQGCATSNFSYSQDDIALAKEEQKTACQNDPASCGIVDSSGISTIWDQCQADPLSCGITNTVEQISSSNISSLSNGWHLLGTSLTIDNMSIFNDAHTVWYFENNRWKVYTFDMSLKQAITDSVMVDTLNELKPNSGFWIMK